MREIPMPPDRRPIAQSDALDAARNDDGLRVRLVRAIWRDDDLPTAAAQTGGFVYEIADRVARTVEQREREIRAELAEVTAERDTNFSLVGRLSVSGFACATQLELVSAERDAFRAATKNALEVYRTHARTAHPHRLHDPSCGVCRMGLSLSRDLPGTPDSIEEIRAWASTPRNANGQEG